MATLGDALRSRQLLVLLDNCEHLVQACAELVHYILRVCPGCQFLATSREALGVVGETAWQVPILSLPNVGDPSVRAQLEASEAMRLFVARARAASRGFVLTNENVRALARLCKRLDGIPLALELAAARVRVLSIEQIAARVDDHYALLSAGNRTTLARQQTLRATIDWSYALLSEPERLLLEQLSVFAGGWTLELCGLYGEYASASTIRSGLRAGLAALEPGAEAHVHRARCLVAQSRRLLTDGLTHLGFAAEPSQANFVLVHVGGDGASFRRALPPRGFVVRDCASFGCPTACGSPADCPRSASVCSRPWRESFYDRRQRHGAAYDRGHRVVCGQKHAGCRLCRLFARHGLAARVTPAVDMDPILLNHMRAILSSWCADRCGASRPHAKYFGHKRSDLWPVVADALDHLRARFDLVIAEGSGSPAEVNLRERDIF